MAIDYSITVNLFTSLDAYSFLSTEHLLNNASENDFLSKIDHKSAYHQVPLNEEDNQFTSFEDGGKLFEFVRLLFLVSNAVAEMGAQMHSDV